MGIISKSSRKKSEYAAATLVSKGCHISGEFKLETDMQVDGLIEGKISAEHTVVISEGGKVIGEIYADKLIVNGKFEGVCYVSYVEILSKGQILGDIYSENLSIEPGGKFTGKTSSAPEKPIVDLYDRKQPESNKNKINIGLEVKNG